MINKLGCSYKNNLNNIDNIIYLYNLNIYYALYRCFEGKVKKITYIDKKNECTLKTKQISYQSRLLEKINWEIDN